MSLSKQLLLLMSVLFVLIFAGNLVIGVKQIRDYLQTEALIHVQDTATSLGLSLSPHMADPSDSILETMIRAIYDMGYYREIRLADVEGRTLVVANDTRVFPEVPPWLMRALPMETAIATSEINRGWQRAGVLEVSVHPGYAYLNLYRLMRQSLWYSLAALLLSVLLLFLVLRLTLRPLRAIQRLAMTIAEGRFARIDPLPWTTEVRQVAKAMNLMSGEVEALVAHLNARLEALGERLQRDPVTGLFGEARLESDLEHRLADGRAGSVMVLRIENPGGHRQSSWPNGDGPLSPRSRQSADRGRAGLAPRGRRLPAAGPGIGPAAARFGCRGSRILRADAGPGSDRGRSRGRSGGPRPSRVRTLQPIWHLNRRARRGGRRLCSSAAHWPECVGDPP